MMRRCVSWMILGVVFAFLAASSLRPQEPFRNTRPVGKVPDVAAEPGADNLYVPPRPGQPFTGKSTVTWVSLDGSQSHFAFMSMLARDSSGKLYFESRWRMLQSGELQPRSNFIVIDPKEQTRTVCFVEQKTCRINAFRRVSFAESNESAELPRATAMETTSLGTSVMDALTVEGRRETTAVAAGAYKNSKPLSITRDIWHSPELDLDVAITKTDPRSGTFARKIEIVSRAEPDPEYFAIPNDYTMFDNRPFKK